MKGRAIIPLILGLGVGFVALKLGIDAVQNAQGSQTKPQDIDVVVATVDIGGTNEITPDMLVIRRSPKSPLLPRDVFRKIEDVAGRVAGKGIPAGTPLSPALLAPEGTLPGLQVKIEEGYRAVSVKIDEVTGVAYQVRPGSYVDVLVVMDVKHGRKKETISRVILQKAQVAAVGQILGDKEDETGKHAKSVTLLLRAEDVPKLHLAQTKGRITLAMRGGEDELVIPNSEATEGELLGEAKAPAAAEKETPDPALPSALISTMTNMLAEAPPVNPPFTTTVINGPLGAEAAGQIIRVTYKHNHSMEVVEVGKGRTAGDTSSLRFGEGQTPSPSSTRNFFGNRDRTLRRMGVQNRLPGGDDERDNHQEIGE